MSKLTLVAIAALLVVTTTAAGTLVEKNTALTNEAPLADAGLDQDVSKGATVLLDGTGSRDPDGSIERYDWSIQTPTGETVAPDCADCARTRFMPTETGRYRVTVTVTDDHGATSSDTLYVDVSPGVGPGVSVAGPTRPTEGATATYTATFSPGTGALDYVVWRVDGTPIANHSLSPEQGADTVEKQFPTVGDRDVTAIVHDADGLTNASSLTVAVQSRPDPPTESPGSGTTTADRNSPQIEGDKVVTGSKPLRGRYDVRLDAPTSDISSVEWRGTAGRIETGRSLTRTWEPGDHELYAVVTYADGSTNVATFSDGTTTVTADPRPNVSFESLDRYGVISGTVSGVDEYENLNGLRLEVDGETVAVTGGTVHGRYRYDFGRQRTLQFSYSEFTPGNRYTITAVATDERGQTVRTSREIVPVKEPEIVRSEFVNGPVDSYHERIDPARYTAQHVLEIDLNGVVPENVDVDFQKGDGQINKIHGGKYSQKDSLYNGNLIVRSYWAGSSPGQYYIIPYMNIQQENRTINQKGGQYNNFQVTPSKPELRIDVVNDGTKEYITRDHGILVNASGSFDPDGTELKYIWKYGAEPTKPDNLTAKFRSYERAASIVEDEYDLKTKRNFDFLNYFVPDITMTVLSEEPYSDKETIRVRVETEPYHFSKQTYYQDFALGVSVSNPRANVVKWETVEAEKSGHSDATEVPYQYVGVIEIPTEALASTSQTPTVSVYNRENTRKETEANLPEIVVSGSKSESWTDVTVQDISYLVENPRTRKVTVDTKRARNQYLKRGYVVDETNEETKYVLEKKVQTEEAKYETETKRFDNRRHWKLFLHSTSGWHASGSYTTEKTRTKKYSRWQTRSSNRFNRRLQDSSLWNGERTGETRTVKVEPAEYRTQRKYSYENEIEKTKTLTVHRSGTRWVTKTGTQTVERCPVEFACYDVTRTYTYRTRETYTYRTTKTYTYTVRKTESYWARSARDSSHTFTGATRRTKISDAVYETQFEVKYKTQFTETVRRYEAARDQKVQDAVYEWRKQAETREYVLARKQVYDRDDWRMTWESASSWVLVRHDGTVRSWTSSYGDESNVVKTKAAVTGTFQTRSYDSEVGRVVQESERKSDTFVYENAKSRNYIVENITGNEEEPDWCHVKMTCK